MNLLMKVKRSANRLYKIIIETSESTCLMLSLEDSSQLWHSRIGHVNFQAMMLMFERKKAYGLPKLIQPKEDCTGCLMSK